MKAAEQGLLIHQRPDLRTDLWIGTDSISHR
jgi:hypothetical protein